MRTATSTESYSYDSDSNVLQFVTRRGDTFSFAYDTLNRMCSKAIATTATLCSATSSSNPTTWYNHDLTGKLVAANDNGAALTALTTSASYSTTAAYDSLNNPTSVSWSPAPAQTTPAAASVTFQLAYDGDNHRTRQTSTNSTWWSYPAATASKLTYNTNTLNQYTCIFATTCSATLLYDANGNLTYDGTFTYQYDAQSRLTGILNGMTTVATYAYDAQSRRKSKTVGSTTTDYVTDADDREVLEYNGSTGAQQTWYAYGIGSNAVLNQMNLTTGTRATLVPDVQGSVIATLDATSGTLSEAGYQTFGENPSVTTGSFRYTAQRFDAETAGSTAEPSGLYYYRARMYSPTLGRFLQTDPGGYSTSGMNLYAYVGNDPLDQTDPSGQCGPFIANCIGGAIGAVFGGIGGGLAGYRATGTLQGTLTGVGVGAVAGGALGAVSPWLVGTTEAAGAAAGLALGSQSIGAGVGAATGVVVAGGLSGAGGAAAADLTTQGQINWPDVRMGGTVGALTAAPEATATGFVTGAGLDFTAFQSSVLGVNTSLLGAVGSIGTTCTVGGGCGPSSASSNLTQYNSVIDTSGSLSNLNLGNVGNNSSPLK